MNVVAERLAIWVERMAATLDTYYGDRRSWYYPGISGGLQHAVIAAIPTLPPAPRLPGDPPGMVRPTGPQWAAGYKEHVAAARRIRGC
jgi:hypothetical protein